VDSGSSQLTAELQSADQVAVQLFASQDTLLEALETGGVEIGLVLPANFDADVQAGIQTDLTLYVWGQSLTRSRAIITAAVTEGIIDLTGRETPIAINAVPVGDRASISWQQRLLPLIVLMAVMFGGMLIPATSMLEERQKRTLTAVTTTPMTMREVFLSKGLMGVGVSVCMALLILALNGGFGANPLLLLMVLALGGTFAAAFGVLLGSLVKDVPTLFTVNKSIGILIYAPALVALFPETIPQWIARLFPTYYILQPVLDISQRGAGLGEVALDLIILLLMTVVLITGLGVSASRLQVREA
jgi:ABC-2 type transport system permease protein